LGNQGDRTLFSVEVMNGRTIKAHSHFVTEDEILLFSGTHMIVQSQLNPAPQLYIIHLKQVIPDEMTLEPPFEGRVKIFDCSFFSNNINFMLRCTYLSENQVSLVLSSSKYISDDSFITFYQDVRGMARKELSFQYAFSRF
jgi:hypothetical protein